MRNTAGTLDALALYLSRNGNPSKIVAWEHNSHLGDARATEMGEDGIIHLDETRALEPLERTAQWEAGEPPETFPSGI